MSEEQPTVHQRMVTILGALPAIGKESENKQQGFHYRSHDDVLNALNPLLAEHGVFVVPYVKERLASTRALSNNRVMFEVNLHVVFTFYGAAGDYVEASAWGEGTDMGDKATNKAMTMAFKNVLAQAFAISTADTVDSDGESPEETVAHQQTAAQPERTRPRSWPQLASRLNALTGEGAGPEWLREAIQLAYGVSTSELDGPERMAAFARACDTLEDLESEYAGAFPPPDRERVARAFARTWDGIALHGPPWRVSPDDPEGLPSHDEYLAAQQVAGDPGPAEPEPEPQGSPA